MSWIEWWLVAGLLIAAIELYRLEDWQVEEVRDQPAALILACGLVILLGPVCLLIEAVAFVRKHTIG